MKYKVGDKVKVYFPIKPAGSRFIRATCPDTGGIDFYDADMYRLHEKVVTIIAVNTNSYRIDKMGYNWLQCWLKPINTIITKRK